MRFIRRFSQLALSLLGSAIVLYAAFGVEGVYDRVVVAIVGLVILEAGIWQITRALFPNEREFKPLRQETEFFLKLVRQLNRAALDATRGAEELDRLEEEMHHSVERLRRLAGKSEAELGLEPPAERRPATARGRRKGQNPAAARAKRKARDAAAAARVEA